MDPDHHGKVACIGWRPDVQVEVVLVHRLLWNRASERWLRTDRAEFASVADTFPGSRRTGSHETSRTDRRRCIRDSTPDANAIAFSSTGNDSVASNSGGMWVRHFIRLVADGFGLLHNSSATLNDETSSGASMRNNVTI